MIPFDFIYCRPDSLQEAFEAFSRLEDERKAPFYYGGGSEIITLARIGGIRPGAVIDIKKIPECTALYPETGGLYLGAVCTLNQIKESKLFPLLSLVCGRIADHTNQCRITLGGNICGTIIYRETSLPLMLCDASVTLFGRQGLRRVAFRSIFGGKIALAPGEFIVSLHVPDWALTARHFHVKHTANEKIDYPLVSLSALIKDNYLRAAFSGVCSSPFRSEELEGVLNDKALSRPERAEKAVTLLPEPSYTDVEGSGEYREFLFRNMVESLLDEVELE